VSTLTRSRSRIKKTQLLFFGTGASALLLVTACVGPIRDRVGQDARAAFIKSRAGVDPPYADVPATRAARNDFINQYIAVKDVQYHNYVKALRRGISYSNWGTDIAKLTVDAFGVLTGTAATKAALAAASGGITGATASFKKDVLFDESVPIFVAKMDALRADVLTEIETKKSNSPSQYPLSEAFNDVERYGWSGSLDAALASMNAQSGNEKITKEDELKKKKDKNNTP
jgi:hypothetical protein